MAAPFPSLTKIWHTTAYPAINPTRPELSAKGKSILITGGGSGIGAEIASAFAKAGATKIALVGRTQQTLDVTKASIEAASPSTTVFTATGDVSDKASIEKAFAAAVNFIGTIDVFVSNAGYLSDPIPVSELDGESWWNGFKINALGSLYAAQAFLPRASPGAYVINISSGIAHFPPMPGFSGYAASKLAGTKFFDYVQAENPSLHVVHVQPGVIETTLSKSSGIPGMDKLDLPASFAVWLTSPEAKFLKGKFAYANWDVDELKARAKDIESGGLLTLSLEGWPFA